MPTKKLSPKQFKILAVLVAIGLPILLYVIYEHWTYVSTDDAQIGAHVTMLSSRVNGTIQKVFVDENQKVKVGDALAQIDTSDYSTASEAAKAEVASLEARVHETDINYKRSTELYAQQAIPKERFDSAQAAYKEATARWEAAKANFEQASLNVSYTRLIAPTDGVIARKSVEPGQFVPAGQPLFGFVESQERWVIANLKETELKGVKIGNSVVVEVDAIDGKSFRGEVESISPSTGATFSLLPPDNSTGNFTKVVQRVPVKIKLRDLSPAEVDQLQAGLSAVVWIRVR